MSGVFSRVRQPVERGGAERYLRLTLLSFAATVVLTRLFLSLTGYPQIGGGGLHIAHMLWGGLLLFVASLLPLVLANRWVYPAGGLLSGVGVGLFIDEVGKFITQNNDYFYPVAAPLIYAFFLLTVLVYLRVRRAEAPEPRAELYRALDDLSEVLDLDLESHERVQLERRLRWVAAQRAQPEMAALARSLLDFLEKDAVVVPDGGPTVVERYWKRVQQLEEHYLGPGRLKLLLVIGLAFLGGPALVAPLALLLGVATASISQDDLGAAVLAAANGATTNHVAWAWSRLLLSAVAGLPLIVAAASLVVKRDRLGTELAYFGLLGYLTVVNLIVFYFDQFQAIGGAIVQFILLRAVIYYRRRYVDGDARGGVKR